MAFEILAGRLYLAIPAVKPHGIASLSGDDVLCVFAAAARVVKIDENSFCIARIPYVSFLWFLLLRANWPNEFRILLGCPF